MIQPNESRYGYIFRHPAEDSCQQHLHADDLLFSITGEVGTLGLIPESFGKAYINQHIAMLRFLKIQRNKYIPYFELGMVQKEKHSEPVYLSAAESKLL